MITGAEFEKIVGSLHSPRSGNISQAYLFDALRRELLASRYSLMFRVALTPVAARSSLGVFPAAQSAGRRPRCWACRSSNSSKTCPNRAKRS